MKHLREINNSNAKPIPKNFSGLGHKSFARLDLCLACPTKTSSHFRRCP